ncbi:hypothetical protein HDU99_004335 [Rhizoclosmatium hyalinum]|nr:hypothetical protein HDU99_004335 [Rhizoclosmatium hyalinum]
MTSVPVSVMKPISVKDSSFSADDEMDEDQSTPVKSTTPSKSSSLGDISMEDSDLPHHSDAPIEVALQIAEPVILPAMVDLVVPTETSEPRNDEATPEIEPPAAEPMVNSPLSNVTEVRVENENAVPHDTPKVQKDVIQNASPLVNCPLTPNQFDCESGQTEENILTSKPLLETPSKIPKPVEDVAVLVNNVMERPKPLEPSFALSSSPVGKTSQNILPRMPLSPLAVTHDEVTNNHEPSDVSAIEDQENVLTASETSDFEAKRQLRKTPARNTRKSTAIQQLDSDISETSETTSHYSLRTTRRTVAKLDADSNSTVSTPAKSRSAVPVPVDSIAKAKTTRAKKTSATATPAARRIEEEDDHPLTLEELTATPVAASKRKGVTKSVAKSSVKAAIHTEPPPSVRLTRRTSKLQE